MPKMKRRIKPDNIRTARASETIDLHGMTSMQAFRILISSVKSVHGAGGGRIKFITGIGNPERGTGVIKNEFPIWLEHFEIAEFIIAATYSSGVYLVRVR